MRETKYVCIDGRPIYEVLGVKPKTVRFWNDTGRLLARLQKAKLQVKPDLLDEIEKKNSLLKGKRAKSESSSDVRLPVGMPIPRVNVSIRVPVDLRTRIQKFVNSSGVSIQELVVEAVDKALSERRF